MSKRDIRFELAWLKALQAGLEAGKASRPTPMIVGSPTTPFGNDIDPDQKSWFVEGGVCGFAWLNFKPGNHPFVNWLKKHVRDRDRSYYGGYDYHIHQFGQSMQRKEAMAHRMAKYFYEMTKPDADGKPGLLAGLTIRPMSRMD